MINTSSCAAAFTQWAAVEAFEGAASDVAVSTMMAEFVERRDVVVAGSMPSPGSAVTSPPGLLRLPQHRGTGWTSGRCSRRSSTRREWPSWPEPPSAATAGGTAPQLRHSVTNLEKGIERIGNCSPGRLRIGPLRRGGGELTEGPQADVRPVSRRPDGWHGITSWSPWCGPSRPMR